MLVRDVVLSQSSSRDLLNACQSSSRDLLYVKCLCVLCRCLSPVVEICYMLNVCVCCVVVSVQ